MVVKTSNILQDGNSLTFKTGDWKNQKPDRSIEKCKHCMFCVAYCPDDCMIVKDGLLQDINLEYCKGCGVCAKVCPFKAIEMRKEEN